MSRTLTRSVMALVGAALALLVALAWTSARASTIADLEPAVLAIGSVAPRVVLSGTAVWRDRLIVNPAVAGRVARVRTGPGARVSKGHVLFEMDDRRARALVRRRQLELERLAELRERGRPGDAGERGDARALERGHGFDIALAKLDMDEATRALAELVVRAPTDGVVVQITVREGDSVGPSGGSAGPAVVLSSDDRIAVDVEGDELDTAGIHVGLSGTLLQESGRLTSPVAARVVTEPAVRRPRAPGQGGAAFGFSVEPLGPTPMLRVGATVRVEVEPARRNDVLVVPLRAVFERNGRDAVLLVRNGALTVREIDVGLVDAAVAEVRSGLSAGDTVLMGSPSRLGAAAEAAAIGGAR